MPLPRLRYMEWAKDHGSVSPPRYNLATSAVRAVTWRELRMPAARIEISGQNAHGDRGVLERLGALYRVRPDQVFSTHGSSLANTIAIFTLVRRGAPVGVEWPVYEPLQRAVEAAGGRIIPIRRDPRNAWHFDPVSLRSLRRTRPVLVVVSNPHNPTGACLDPAEFRSLADAVRPSGGLVLCDEVYRDAYFDPPVSSAAELGGRFLVTSSLTKAYGFGSLRAGWAIGPPGAIRGMRRAVDHFTVLNSYIVDRITRWILDTRGRWRERARRIRDENAPRVAVWLARRPNWRCTFPSGGFVCLVRLPGRLTSRRLEGPLRERHATQVSPGRFFGLDRYVRIGHGGPRAELEEGLRRLARCADELGADQS